MVNKHLKLTYSNPFLFVYFKTHLPMQLNKFAKELTAL